MKRSGTEPPGSLLSGTIQDNKPQLLRIISRIRWDYPCRWSVRILVPGKRFPGAWPTSPACVPNSFFFAGEWIICYICGKILTFTTMQENEGKYIFGVVKVGDKGQIVIPKEARTVYNIKPGDALLMLGDQKGMALLKTDIFQSVIDQTMEGLTK